ncbi:MAG: phosphonate C-P lyase system protein PhnG [Propionibacteriaceae bacterium]|nr:phosphonate C-P lyase system protein PhnG [Propionibacteriaceae bacterium]
MIRTDERASDMDSGAMSREELCQWLAAAERAELISLANEVLSTTDVEVVRGPEVGTVATQVREPIAGTRFLLCDALVSSAEVLLDGVPGWSMRLGDDPEAALAQAVCEAELVRDGELAPRLRQLCADIAAVHRMARAAEWEQLAPTVVEFEEIP